MVQRHAPEARGSWSQQQGWARSRSAVLLVALAAVLAVAVAAPDRTARATSPDATAERRLQPVPAAARPDFTLLDLDGAQLALQAQAGRVVLVHFFATWCEPCRDELAALTRLASGPQGPLIAVLAVDVGEVPVRVRRFFQASPVPFPVLLDSDRATSRAWRVGILPTTFVLDARLRARHWVEGDLDWTRADVLAAIETLHAEAGAPPDQPSQAEPKSETQ